MVSEPNNLISAATNSGISSTAGESASFSSDIDKLTDIDLYQFQLDQGQGITLDIDTINAANNTANFDSFLRLFDSQGNELTVNDDYAEESVEFGLDSYIGFIANTTGDYYVGVSSVANQQYDPLNGTDLNPFAENFIPGNYELTLNVVDVIADEDQDNTISEARNTEIAQDNQSSTLVTNEIETKADADLYRFQLGQGKGVQLNLNATENSELDSYLRLFDAEGNELAFSDNSDDPNNITNDSAIAKLAEGIAFAPDTAGEYFVGVSSAGNFDYDVINGDTNLNFSPNTGISTGSYGLQLEVVDIVADSDPDNTITEAIDSQLSISDLTQDVFSGEIDTEFDIDLFKIELRESEGVYLDINTDALDSELNSLLRVFDDQGNELAFDDDANFTEDVGQDSYLAFLPTTLGTYYVGVGTSGNFDYDPIAGRNNFSSQVTSPLATTGTYELGIEVAEVIADEDPDNTITEAVDTKVGATGSVNDVFNGKIDAEFDVDFFQFELGESEGVYLDINTDALDSELNSFLRVFDGEGKELTFDNDDDANFNEGLSKDSFLAFLPETLGIYYVGVGASGNFNYDPLNGNNNFSSNLTNSAKTTGDYELTLEIGAVVLDEDPDNTITEAIDTGISSLGQQSTLISDAIDSETDIDLYQLQLNQGDTVNLDIDAAELSTGLDSVMQVFNGDGQEIAVNDDQAALDEDSSLDSYIRFTAGTTGKYYVGVSSFDNFNYNPLQGSSNFDQNIGSSVGNYELAVAITDSNNSI